MIRFFICVWAVLIAIPASAQVSSFTLENGMEAVVIEDHRAPVVTHMVWYKVGSADEAPGKSGIAHYLEHLMFKGTEKMAAGEFSDIIAQNGGSENAFTSFDYTAYFQRVASDRLALMMELEADRMQGLTLSEEEVLPELDVVIQERNQRVDSNPSAFFGEHRRALMFQNHPYGRPIIGWMHEIEGLTRQDALDFYNKYYAPNNAILVVAGDVTPQEVERLARKYYGPLVPSETIPERIRPQEPPKRAPIRTVLADDRVGQPYVIRTYLAPSRKPGAQEEAAALVILANLLGGSGITSVFGQKLQIEEQVSIGQTAFYDDTAYDDGVFTIYAAPAPGTDLETLEARMDAAIADFLDSGVDEDHLARIKTQIAASEIYIRDDQSALARRYGTGLSSGLTLADIESWSEVLANVTAEDIMQAAGDVFDLSKSVTGWLVKEELSE